MASTTDMSVTEPAQATYGTAGTLVLDYVNQQLADLKRHVPAVLKNRPDAVHQMRQATRRLRSGLASAKKLFDADAVTHLRDELKWIAEVLGEARDVEVAHERIKILVESEPDQLVLGRAAERLEEWFEHSSREGQRSVAEALNSERYSALLKELKAFATHPPATDKAQESDSKGATRLIGKESRRLQRKFDELQRVRHGGADSEGTSNSQAAQELPARDPEIADSGVKPRSPQDVALHELRKASKRLRYAAEIASPAAGREAIKLEKDAHKLQKILGIHQDTVVLRELLLSLASQAGRSGENGFSYGRLHAKEETTARKTEADFDKAWKKFRDKKLSAHL